MLSCVEPFTYLVAELGPHDGSGQLSVQGEVSINDETGTGQEVKRDFGTFIGPPELTKAVDLV
jgi:hypothetical protein